MLGEKPQLLLRTVREQNANTVVRLVILLFLVLWWIYLINLQSRPLRHRPFSHRILTFHKLSTLKKVHHLLSPFLANTFCMRQAVAFRMFA